MKVKVPVFLPEWIIVMANIAYNNSIADVDRKAKASGYAVAHHAIINFENKGWVTLNRVGRMQLISLTPEGKIIQDACQVLVGKGIGRLRKRHDGTD